MRVNLTSDEWTTVEVPAGTLQNLSPTASIEIVEENEDENNSGIVLYPRQKFAYSNNVTIKARSVWDTDVDSTQAVILAIEPIVSATGGGGGGGGGMSTFAIGSVTTGEPGTSAIVTNSGTASNVILNFTIPRGDSGADGRSFTISGLYPTYVDMVTANPNPVQGEAHFVGTSDDNVIYFWDTSLEPPNWTNAGPLKGLKGDTGAQGATGPQGPQGDTPTVSVGSVTSGATPSVTNTGSSTAAIFDFVLPKGDKGDAGEMRVGSVTIGTPVAVTNSGTSTDAVWDFVIPPGTGSDWFYLRRNEAAYVAGDIAYSLLLPSWMRLRCVTGGTTGSTEPVYTASAGAQVSDGTVTWAIEDQRMSAIIESDPVFFARSELIQSARTTLTMPAQLNVNIGGAGCWITGAETIDLTDADSWDNASYATAINRAGKDFYVYACQDFVAPHNAKIVLSHNSTVPTGYTADNSRKIGGFHCLCLSVGTISGHALSGYETGDILPLSIWDLKHRAISENEGMVYIPEVGKWVDIYLASYDGAKLVSQFGGITADGESSPNFHGEKFVEYFGLVKKQLPSRDDFMVFAKGSNEGTNISGSAVPNTTGGHVDTNSRRMISNYGLEDCCGALWQWTNDCPENYPGSTWNASSTPYSMGGYAWQTNPVYNPNCDTQSYGSCNGLLRRLLVGGIWGGSSYCGSRCVTAAAFGSVLAADVASRGCSNSRI